VATNNAEYAEVDGGMRTNDAVAFTSANEPAEVRLRADGVK
jgi:hypothetical protein